MQQPTFLAKPGKAHTSAAERIVLHALGEFQSRGKILAERELPLERLLGALRRAAGAFDVEDLADEQVVSVLETLGASIRHVPAFVAKHPYRVIVSSEMAARALQVYRESLNDVTQQDK